MKKFKFLLMLLLGVVMSFTFVSCGDDDDDDNNNNSGKYAGSPIVGSWVCKDDNGTDTYTSTYTFKADGTFTYTNEHEGVILYEKSGTFLYDKDSKKLTLHVTNATTDKNIGYADYNVEIVANEYVLLKNFYSDISTKYIKK